MRGVDQKDPIPFELDEASATNQTQQLLKRMKPGPSKNFAHAVLDSLKREGSEQIDPKKFGLGPKKGEAIRKKVIAPFLLPNGRGMDLRKVAQLRQS